MLHVARLDASQGRASVTVEALRSVDPLAPTGLGAAQRRERAHLEGAGFVDVDVVLGEASVPHPDEADGLEAQSPPGRRDAEQRAEVRTGQRPLLRDTVPGRRTARRRRSTPAGHP